MTPEVTEVELTLEQANANQDEIYKEQAAVGMTASADDVEASEQALREDLKARLPQSEAEEPVAQEPEKEETPEKSPEEILAELGLKHEPKKRTISDGENEREYVQKPLSFVGKIQFLSYIGEVLDKAMAGDNALKLNSLFDVPVRGDVLSAQDFSDAQTFVQAVGKLLVYAPDFLSKSYCIWLRIPEYERAWAIACMEENLGDEEGFDIIETFIDQNWETLQGFFSEKLPSLSKRLQARYRASQSEQQKLSKFTQQNTQKNQTIYQNGTLDVFKHFMEHL